MLRQDQAGFTLIELIVAFTVMLILATMAVPLARAKVRVERERELRRDLTEMRNAIDKYKDMCDQGMFGPIKQGTYCYPESLDQLVEGVKLAQSANGDKIRFLRRIPRDPYTHKEDWGMRANQDDPKSQSFGGQNLYDVYTKTSERALDGTQLSEW
jgi:general secretion pathway protein G